MIGATGSFAKLFFFRNPDVAHSLARRDTNVGVDPQQSEAACGLCLRPALPPALRLLRTPPQRLQMMDSRIYGQTDLRSNRLGLLTL